ncbi:hypothetical protein L1987_66166 [Smallanthus sonchifolius]|uniref:Uncharacterized protein n=1 Tax=Smallanthus sonchifolius TaxID=185202 RepID=A0ACB9BWQ8_9ASTR|nr:hypothetical protein L1987_66166 [Smallanthus sonchifolius]
MDEKKTKKPSIAIRVLKAPVRVVCKIRDLYVSSMYKCAAGMGGPTGPYTSGLPKSYSTASSRTDDDFAELMRIASTRSLGKRLGPEFLSPQQPVVPRSQSVAIGRIDEDKSCDFGNDFRLNSEMFPRSKSHAVSRMYT